MDSTLLLSSCIIALLNLIISALPQSKFDPSNSTSLIPTLIAPTPDELICMAPDKVPIPITYPLESDCWAALLKMRRDPDFLNRKIYAYRFPYRAVPPSVKVDRYVPIIFESGTCVAQVDLMDKKDVEAVVIKNAWVAAMRVLEECIRKPTTKHRIGGVSEFEDGKASASIHGSLRALLVATE